ncbi:heme exporter protein CcmD [Rhizobium sp. G21]|uniref:heme exporter protein CcmD n=1 Tax=Rhizobium sp. G21 TaxID=2758439 RepID=UPI0016039660|nr:heme exporter protein CcmD [Rhizobium sp. G21]MBB1249680.1 heme exporter protein CcmD [Rhizobium sp. G21]
MNHAFYVYASWGAAALVLLGVIASTWLDSRKLKADLKRLEAQGIRRRSAGSDAA